MEKIKLIAIIGKAGSGKNTFLNKITSILDVFKYKGDDPDCKEYYDFYQDLKDKFNETYNIIIPFTTRPMREGEINGKDYHFIDEDKIGNMIENGTVAQVEDFRGWLYGTLWDDYDPKKLNIGIFNPRAVEYLNDYDNMDITTIYITAPDKDRLLRQLNREDNPDIKEIIRRYGTDEIDFDEAELKYLPNVHRIDNSNTKLRPKDNKIFRECINRDKLFFDIINSVKLD